MSSASSAESSLQDQGTKISLDSPQYKCAACGCADVRLYRTDKKVLGCIKCIVRINRLRISMQERDYGSSTKIAGFYPAVPRFDGSDYHQYGYAAAVDMDRWRLLPKY